jgi:hypothetical protein
MTCCSAVTRFSVKPLSARRRFGRCPWVRIQHAAASLTEHGVFTGQPGPNTPTDCVRAHRSSAAFVWRSMPCVTCASGSTRPSDGVIVAISEGAAHSASVARAMCALRCSCPWHRRDDRAYADESSETATHDHFSWPSKSRMASTPMVSCDLDNVHSELARSHLPAGPMRPVPLPRPRLSAASA